MLRENSWNTEKKKPWSTAPFPRHIQKVSGDESDWNIKANIKKKKNFNDLKILTSGARQRFLREALTIEEKSW